MEVKQEFFDDIWLLNDQRYEKIEQLTDILIFNDSVTEEKSLKLLQEILGINSQIKLMKDQLVINRINSK
jgi:hypothetical protein